MSEQQVFVWKLEGERLRITQSLKQISKRGLSLTIVNGWKLLTIVAKSPILDFPGFVVDLPLKTTERFTGKKVSIVIFLKRSSHLQRKRPHMF